MDSSDAANVDVPTQVIRIVTGIVGYSRWPVAPEIYRLCIAGDVSYLQEPQSRLSMPGEGGASVRIVHPGEILTDVGCDILYLGALKKPYRKSLLAQAMGQPILTISENDALCADATMFCLAVRDNDVSLLANLDAIALSKVRINPKVLQLLQRKHRSP